MKKYEIEDTTIYTGEAKFVIVSNDRYFAGYSFMGDDEWESDILSAYYCADLEEAEMIIHDLEAADEPDEPDPADKQYLFKVKIEDEWIASVKTGKQIAEYYDEDQFCGICSEMQAWDISGDPKRISLLDLVEPILNQKRWMEQEYRDYCDNVNEYGLDFEGRDE